MPAAGLVRLRHQINQLILAFSDPELFCSHTRALLHLYAHT